MHIEGQVHALLAGVIAPGLAETVRAIVAGQSDLSTDRGYELPGLTALDGLRIVMSFGIEEHEVLTNAGDVRIGREVFGEGRADTVVDDDLMAFAALLLTNPEVPSDVLPLIHKITDAKTQDIRDPEGGVDAHYEQQRGF